MRGLWISGDQLLQRDDLEDPIATDGEAVVRVRLAGICATDMELLRGYMAFEGIPGHEFVGEIVEAPSAPERVGERVVGEINAACGHCELCHQGLSRHCSHRTVLGIQGRNGAHAHRLALPLDNLIPVPEAVSDEQAVFVEPLAAALEILDQLPLGGTHRVLLVGAGRLGQLIARVLRLTGCELVVVAKHTGQRALLEAVGVDVVSPEEVKAQSFHVVVEASGSAAAFALAQKALRPRGTLVVKSTYAGPTSVDLASVVIDEITILGSRCGAFAPALRLLEDGLVDCAPLIEQRFSLRAGRAAYEQVRAPGAMKVLLEP